MKLNEFQHLANQPVHRAENRVLEVDSLRTIVRLFRMAGDNRESLGEHEMWLRDCESFRPLTEPVKEKLSDLLWYLSDVATQHGLTLEELADLRLRKTARQRESVGVDRATRKLFDEDFPSSERLPRQMDILIEDESGAAITTIDGAKFGDPLTDNRDEDDGYRFHDIYHLSYASILGWSPTLRALLRRKRKSNPRFDLVEDGGRAICIEEGIAAMVFSYAERRNFLEVAEGVNYDLLRTIKDMTSHLEVSARTEGDWERAIMTGFDIWRQVKANGRGRIHADLMQGKIELIG